MDWNLKTPWDLAGFEQEIGLKSDLVSGSSSFVGHRIKGDFSIDLKLGHVVDSGNESADNLKVSDMSKMALSASGSSKRQRAVNNGIQAASCLVDGCDADLSNCREYHRRHKVCEIHSKTPQVTIGGHKQRFCQQCSRFHSLEEFDDGKRSCRKRLDGHNRRRRKAQPEILSNTGSFLSPNCQAGRMLPFLGSQVYPSTAVANPLWAGVVKPGENAKLLDQNHGPHLLHKQIPLPGSSRHRKGVGMQFGNLHGTNIAFGDQTVREGSVCRPLLGNVVSSESGGCSHEMFYSDLSGRVHNLDCALSLLSSLPTETSGISLSRVVPPVHPSGPSLLEPLNSVLVSNTSQDDFHHAGMRCTGPDGPSDGETPQTVHFHWQL